MKIEEIVNGENLKSLADVVIDVDTVGQSRDFDGAKIVFCKTDLLNVLFSELTEFNGELTLITHLSDHSITESLFNSRPKCVKKWFAQNADYQHEDLIPVPIGIENHKGPSKGTCIDLDFIKNELDSLKDYTKAVSIYVNFADTNPSRAEIRNVLMCDLRADFAANKKYGEYFNDLAQHMFVASPRGNGIDCHRTWEALLVWSIPIVDRHFMYDKWNIPVIQVDYWSDLGNLKRPKDSSMHALYMDYWREKIRG